MEIGEKMIKNAVEKLNALLELPREAVGVKLVYCREEFEQFSAVRAIKPISYCVAVKSASLGHSVKFTAGMSGCGGSTRALGLVPPSAEFLDGSEGRKLGLYSTRKVAAGVSQKMRLCKSGTYGVIVKPARLMETDPDVVLVICDTRTTMRIIQGYTYYYGIQDHFCMTGNQAVCVEATAVPITTGELNVSMFCSGTRYLAKWKDTEVAVGIPAGKLENTVEGIRMTVNAVEPDNRKLIIREKLRALGYPEDEIILGDTYYLRLEREKQKYRRKRTDESEK